MWFSWGLDDGEYEERPRPEEPVDPPAGWRPVWGESMDGDLGSVLGLVWHGRVVLGLVMRGNYPATDQVWPGRCGELGIVVGDRVYGVWNDPGF